MITDNEKEETGIREGSIERTDEGFTPGSLTRQQNIGANDKRNMLNPDDFYVWMIRREQLAESTARNYMNAVRECSVIVQKWFNCPEWEFYSEHSAEQICRVTEALIACDEFRNLARAVPELRSGLRKFCVYARSMERK